MKKIFSLALVALFFAACGNNGEKTQQAPDRDVLLDSISQLEQAIEDPSAIFSADTAEMMFGLYSRFVQYFPDDDLTPGYMLRMADIEVNRGNLEQGVALYDSIIEKYTPGGFDGYADCMYKKALALDQDGEHGEQAIAAYGAFIEQFPEHYLVPEAKKSMKISEMSQKELLATVHEWEKKDKKK